MRTCVIFNPVAKGGKARRFRRHLDEIGAAAQLKLTAGPGDARRLATQAVEEGFEVVAAAGGDGTLNEVLNGIGDATNGFEHTRLGVVPLGTVNVFARELGIPARLHRSWEILRRGQEIRIDLPKAEFSVNGKPQTRYFAQLAGAGLDARAVELVRWKLKKKIGFLAYVVAGLQALREAPAAITAADGSNSCTGSQVVVGNGRLYGGDFRIFPQANLRDGLLDVCVLPRVTWLTLVHCTPRLLLTGRLPRSAVVAFQSSEFTLQGATPAPFELDGELVGHLPVRFSVERSRLRVIAP